MTSTIEASASIRQTVANALRATGYGSYMEYADPVIEALTAREAKLSGELIDFGVDSGGDESEIRSYLSEIGMNVSPVSPEVDVDSVITTDALREIGEQLRALTEFARANGFRG